MITRVVEQTITRVFLFKQITKKVGQAKPDPPERKFTII